MMMMVVIMMIMADYYLRVISCWGNGYNFVIAFGILTGDEYNWESRFGKNPDNVIITDNNLGINILLLQFYCPGFTVAYY